MMVEIREQLVGSLDKTFGDGNPCRGVTIHETANTDNGADAAATADYQSNGAGGRQASWHWQVDDREAVQSYPHTARCWHAGDGDDPDGGNMTTIAVEICVNADGDLPQAYRNAAELVREVLFPEFGLTADDVCQHHRWSGKECPRMLRGADVLSWSGFVRLVRGDDVEMESVPMAGMTSPVKGRVSSEYGPRDYAPSPFHAGIDIAAPIGTPVYAAFAGVVKDEGSNVAPYRSGTRNVLIENPDGEGQYYGHLHRNFVRVGEHVAQGEKIGEVGARGNVTGPHLHFEIWSDADVPSSHRNPRIDFNYFGITPGSAPKGTSEGSGGGRPSGGTTGGHGGGGPMSDLSETDVRNIQKALRRTGDYKGRIDGVAGPMTVQAVKDYQARQNRYGNAGLRVDGDWGWITQGWFDWVKELQRALPAWKGVPNLVVDGDYGPKTHNAVATVQRRNGLYEDGFAGPKTTRFMRKYGSDVGDRP